MGGRPTTTNSVLEMANSTADSNANPIKSACVCAYIHACACEF